MKDKYDGQTAVRERFWLFDQRVPCEFVVLFDFISVSKGCEPFGDPIGSVNRATA